MPKTPRCAGSSDGLVVRPARQGEEARLAEVSHRAFRVTSVGEPDPVARWAAYYKDHGHLKPGDVLCAEADGELVGCAAALRFQMGLAGGEVAMGHRAGVAVQVRLVVLAGRRLAARLARAAFAARQHPDQLVPVGDGLVGATGALQRHR